MSQEDLTLVPRGHNSCPKRIQLLSQGDTTIVPRGRNSCPGKTQLLSQEDTTFVPIGKTNFYHQEIQLLSQEDTTIVLRGHSLLLKNFCLEIIFFSCSNRGNYSFLSKRTLIRFSLILNHVFHFNSNNQSSLKSLILKYFEILFL